MDYQKIYDNLIHKARHRVKIDTEQIEIHHVRPRCLGGSDDQSNLVELTLREHFFAHLILCKLHKNISGLFLAVFLMSKSRQLKTSKEYSFHKLQFRRSIIERQFQKSNSINDYIKSFATWWVKTDWLKKNTLTKTAKNYHVIKEELVLDDDDLRNYIFDEFICWNNIKVELQLSNKKSKSYRRMINTHLNQVKQQIFDEFILLSKIYYTHRSFND